MKFEKKGECLYVLDVKGYVCPHPQLYTKKALAKLNAGDVLELAFDNPSSAESVAAMLELTGDEVLEKVADGAQYLWKIRKAAPA